ncbi:response regulator transcription factor [Erysipelothrix sp. HDW6C]|uniref:response regulator transcription factor n=1 Tax=Erysipelothrix sp. HDW6C TaxID=2714930 RepID=UPI00140D83BF|nr:response regulator transcription factor [Erysipelothrix sp. HDW6C]QIK69647.1 response regulator transcription factor [Erysipelothrix sp. HDW6C]
MEKILIADDNQNITNILKDYAQREGFDVYVAEDGERALQLVAQHRFAMILLDVMMPVMDGFDVCKSIRSHSNVPIIMITARGDDYDRIMGLDIGADDYIVKPFVPAEVMARIRAILRRIGHTQNANILEIDSLMVNLDEYEVRIDNEPILLTKKEIEILWTLMEFPNRVFTRDNLLDKVWGTDYYGDSRTVDSHIKRLRSKLDGKGSMGWAVATVWGLGYKFEVNHNAS